MTDEQPQPGPTDAPKAVSVPSAGRKPKRSKRSRRWRFITRVLAGVVLGLPVAVIVLTQGPVAEWIVRQVVRARLGAEFSAEWVSLKTDGRVVVSRMKLDAPGMSGPEAHVIAAERVEVELEWRGFAGLDVQVREVKLSQPVLRVSMGPQGELNLSRILMPSGSSTPSSLPRITVDHGAIELAEHDPGATSAAERFRLMARAEVSGAVAPVKTGSDEFLIDFTQVGGSPLGAGGTDLHVGGKLSLKTGEGAISVSGLDLSKWTPERVPRALRESWSRMKMQGEVSKAELTFSRDGALAVEIDTRDVSLFVPVAAGPTETLGQRFPLMTNVHGKLRFFQGSQGSGIEADLVGLFEYDVPCHVRFHSEGITLDSAYSAEVIAEGFAMDPTLRVWWLAPDSVKQIMTMFSGPSATVDARINIKRAAKTGDEDPEPAISGTVAFKDGAAKFARFPYPVAQLTGSIHFDDREVIIDSISGRGPTGAIFVATGKFSPPTDLAAVRVEVNMVDVPFDEHLQAAVDGSRGKDLLKSIFSHARLKELQDRGLVVTDERRMEIERGLAQIAVSTVWNGGGIHATPVSHWQRLSELMAAAKAPVFSLRGDVKEVKVLVTREYGETAEYQYQVGVEFKEITLLPQVFAFPLMGEGVELTINDDSADLKAPVLRGLEGGTASLMAQVKILPSKVEGGESEYQAWVQVHADDIPVTPLLINAVPENAARAMGRPEAELSIASSAPGVEPLTLSPQRLLRELGVQGVVECDADVKPGAGEDVTFDVNVRFEDLIARPTGQSGPVVVTATDVAGSLKVTDQGLTINEISGHLRTDGAAAESGAPSAGAPATLTPNGTFVITGATTFGDGAHGVKPTLMAQLLTRGLDLGTPVESFVRVLTPEAADLIAGFRRDRRPSGRIDADIGVNTASAASGAAGTEVSLTLHRTENFEMDLLGGRVQVEQQGGTAEARVTRGAGTARDAQTNLKFDRFQVQLGMDGERALTVQVDGAGRLAPPSIVTPTDTDPGLELFVDETMKGMVASGVLESALTRKLIGLVGGAQAKKLIDDLQLRGIIESEFQIYPDRTLGAEPGSWSLHAVIWPTRLAITTDEVAAVIPEVHGRLTIDGTSGSLDGLQLDAGPWMVTLDGAWAIRQDETEGTIVDVDAGVWFNADDVSESLLALTPKVVRDAIQGLGVRAPGGVDMQDASVHVSLGESGVRTVEFEGALNFADAAADVGIDIDNVTGALGVRVTKRLDDPGASIAIDLAASALRAAGVDIAHARGAIRTSATDDNVRIEYFDGACYGGRIAGHALLLSPEVQGEPRRYEARVQVGGVRVSDMLLALRRAAGAPTAVADASLSVFGSGQPVIDGQNEPAIVADERRGWMDAELSLTGVAGDNTQRQGRGTMRITGGDVLDMPLAVQLIQLSNLQLPFGDKLDYFHAAFWMDGRTVRFDQLGLLSNNLAIMGVGEMQVPDLDLNLTVSSQSRMRLPLVSDLFELVRNEFIMARVTGTLDDPSIGAEPLRGTRAILGGIFGAPLPEDPAAHRAQIERERGRAPWSAPSSVPQP